METPVDKGMFLGKFTYRDGGLVRMDPGGPTKKQAATDNNDPKKTDNSQPYMYLDQKTNTWLRPPENRDQNQMIDWSVNQPAFSTGTMNMQGGKKVSPEEAAKAKEYYRQEALKTPEGLEEERNRLMQEFVDQENANKSELQKSFGNLSLDNPATRDAARNYAGYKLGESNPKNMLDRMFTGSDEVGLRDFYRPHDSSMILTVPAAAAAVSLAAGAAPLVAAAAPAYSHALHAVMDKAILRSPLTLGRALKADAAFQVGTDYIPHGIESAYNYFQTGDTDYLKAAGKDAAMIALNAGSYYGRAAKVIAGVKKPAVIAGYVKDAFGMGESRDNLREYGVDNTAPAGGFKADSESTAVRNVLPTPMITSEKNGGNISVPNFSRQEGGDMPFGLPLKEQNIYTLPEYNQPRNSKTGEILPDPRRPNLGMGTGATEYKTTIGYDEGDVDAPMIVSGQYVGPQGAIDRYELTGERFKTMTDPGSYSNFYEQIGELGLMQEKHGGSVKRVRIKSLPKNWKTQ
jgi:hypothetical protein